MNQSGQTHPAVQPMPGELPIAALLRLAADDELTADQRSRLDAHLAAHPEDAARIDFERRLHSACARACCPCGCAPAGLRERITGGLEARPGVRSGGTGESWLVRSVARYGALAALVALVALVGFMVGRTSPDANPIAGRTLAASLAGFVRSEHNRCTEGGPAIESKFYIRESGVVPEEFSAIVGRPVSIPCLIAAESGGLHFVDAGLCHPPGGDAMHIRFRTGPDTDSGPLVSLWVQIDDGKLPLEDGVTYTLGQGCDCVRFWRVEGIRYVLVCPDERYAPAVSLALASPATTRPF